MSQSLMLERLGRMFQSLPRQFMPARMIGFAMMRSRCPVRVRCKFV